MLIFVCLLPRPLQFLASITAIENQEPNSTQRVRKSSHGELRSSFLIHANAKEFKGATLRFLETYFPWHMNHYPEDDGKYYYSKVKR